jgi:hypothetical protein
MSVLTRCLNLSVRPLCSLPCSELNSVNDHRDAEDAQTNSNVAAIDFKWLLPFGSDTLILLAVESPLNFS